MAGGLRGRGAARVGRSIEGSAWWAWAFDKL